MKRPLFYLLFILLAPVLSGCKRNPIDRLTNPLPDGAVEQFGPTYVIYDDEIKTGGGLGLIPGGENQSINLSDASGPRRSTFHIVYNWNGGEVTDFEHHQTSHTYAGYSFTITPDFSTFDAAHPRNLSGPGYTKLKMFIRGSVASDNYVRIEGPNDGSGGITPVKLESDTSPNVGTKFTLTSDWQEIELPVTASHFNAVKTYFTVSIQYVQPGGTTVAGLGGTVYVDDVRYVNE